MDPITSILVTAAIQGAVAGLKPTAEQAIKDAYSAFKHVILERYKNHKKLIEAVETLEQKPEDAHRRAAVENELTNAGANKDPVLVEAANAIHIAGAASSSKKKILGNRIQRKLKQVEALENQIDLSLDEGQKVIIQEKAEGLWGEITKLEEELAAM